MEYIKRGIVTIFILVMLSIMVYADSPAGTFAVTNETGCSDNNTIMRLSGSTNAHGSLWNTSSYSKKLCYTPTDPSTIGASSHDCTADNLVIKLSGETNAHGQAPQFTGGYSLSVCYDNLNCTGNDAGCPEGTVCVLRLSGSTNAHISDCSSGYGVRICCGSGEIPEGMLPPIPPEFVPLIGGGAPCTSDSNCTSPQICEAGSCITPTTCTSSSDCSENQTCVSNGGTSICRNSTTTDLDGDGLIGHNDPCEGNTDPTATCNSPGTGLSCSSIDGIICNTNCVNGNRSLVSREANCWTPNTCTCSSAPTYVTALGTTVRFNRECVTGNNCLAKVTVVDSSSGANVGSSSFSALGITSNPYTEQDTGCCGINLQPTHTGEQNVPGYGMAALLISIFGIGLFYLKRRN